MRIPLLLLISLAVSQPFIAQNIGINTSNPLHPLQVNVDSLSQEVSDQSNALHNGFYLINGTQKAAQSFQPSLSGLLTKVNVRLNVESPGTTSVVLKLHSNSPSGIVLATSQLDITEQFISHKNYSFHFTTQGSLVAGSVYAISLEKTAGPNIEWRKSNSNPYLDGSAAVFNGTSWSPQTANDMVFDVFINTNQSTNINAMNVSNNGNIGIGINTPKEKLEVSGAIKIGANNDANPESGTIRWNDSTSDFEGFNGSKWVSLTNNIGWGGKNGNEDQQLLATGLEFGDYFGISMSISGNYAVVGAYGDDDNGGNSGAAYVFYYTNNTWSQQAKLVASDGAAVDFFGKSVAIDGDYIIIGAENNLTKGAAYIFLRTGTTWAQQAKLTDPVSAVGDEFGSSVSISGEYVVIGALGDDSYTGSAYIFQRTGAVWGPKVKLTAPSGDTFDYFGESVSISGDVAVIGAKFDDDVAVNAGAAYVYLRNGANWNLQSKLLPTSGDAADFFGSSVSVSGSLLIVGAPNDDEKAELAGTAYIYEYVVNTWVLADKIVANDGRTGAAFGESVSMHGNSVIVGAMRDDLNGANAGAAYIFKKDNNSWIQEAKLLPSDFAPENYFGLSVAIFQNFSMVGAPNPQVSSTGKTYFFNNN